MPKVYQTLVKNGKRTWEQVPDNLKNDVKTLLKLDVEEGVLTKEEFKKLVGEEYVV